VTASVNLDPGAGLAAPWRSPTWAALAGLIAFRAVRAVTDRTPVHA